MTFTFIFSANVWCKRLLKTARFQLKRLLKPARFRPKRLGKIPKSFMIRLQKTLGRSVW